MNTQFTDLELCPTREPAIQVCEEINHLASALKGLTAVPIYGGAPIDRQIRTLRKGAHVVVSKLGRVMDHLRRWYTSKMSSMLATNLAFSSGGIFQYLLR